MTCQLEVYYGSSLNVRLRILPYWYFVGLLLSDPRLSAKPVGFKFAIG